MSARKLGSWVLLLCAACQRRFSYRFTFGCMIGGEARTPCPECGATIRFVEGERLKDGSVVIDIIGATRGLHLTLGEDVTDDTL